MRASPQRITDSSLRSAVSVCKSSSWMPPGLQHRGEVTRVVIRDKNKWAQRRHLTGVERTLKLRSLSFFSRAVNFSALDSFAQRLLDRRQDSVAPFCILLMLLVITEPERRVNANEHQN